jgi:hypothetical protein
MAATPQARKLGLKAGLRVGLDAPPNGWQLTEPPGGLLPPDEDGADVMLAFFRAADEITDRLPALAKRVFPAGAVWALWPRRAAGHVRHHGQRRAVPRTRTRPGRREGRGR